MIFSVYASHKGTQSQADKYEKFQNKMEHLFIISMGIFLEIFVVMNKHQVCYQYVSHNTPKSKENKRKYCIQRIPLCFLVSTFLFKKD